MSTSEERSEEIHIGTSFIEIDPSSESLTFLNILDFGSLIHALNHCFEINDSKRIQSFENLDLEIATHWNFPLLRNMQGFPMSLA